MEKKTKQNQKSTHLRKLVETYCTSQGLSSRADLRFLFDGMPIEDMQTASELGMEDFDIVDVMECQSGG